VDKNKIGVHLSHCCLEHGCKYNAPDCPVASGELAQLYPCDTCVEELEQFKELTTKVLASPEKLAEFLSQLCDHTSDTRLIGPLADAVTRLRGY
jgi:flavoprotein